VLHCVVLQVAKSAAFTAAIRCCTEQIAYAVNGPCRRRRCRGGDGAYLLLVRFRVGIGGKCWGGDGAFLLLVRFRVGRRRVGIVDETFHREVWLMPEHQLRRTSRNTRWAEKLPEHQLGRGISANPKRNTRWAEKGPEHQVGQVGRGL